MKEFIYELIQAIATAAIPVLATYIVMYLRKAAKRISTETDSDLLKNAVNEAADAVATAVTYTSQTYVDALKKEGIHSAARASAEGVQRTPARICLWQPAVR